jgi:hypothetical protein
MIFQLPSLPNIYLLPQYCEAISVVVFQECFGNCGWSFIYFIFGDRDQTQGLLNAKQVLCPVNGFVHLCNMKYYFTGSPQHMRNYM